MVVFVVVSDLALIQSKSKGFEEPYESVGVLAPYEGGTK